MRVAGSAAAQTHSCTLVQPPRSNQPKPSTDQTLNPHSRSYFLAPKGELVSELTDDVKAANDQMGELEKQQLRAQTALQDIEKEVHEVTRDNPAAAVAFRKMMGGA